MSLLDHPEAQAILQDAVVSAEDVEGCMGRLTQFIQRYLPCFYRVEQRRHALLVIRGLLSGLDRKTCEPIAIQSGQPRKPVQFFVGSGKWDDEAVMTELRRHVAEKLGERDGVLIIDPSAFPKKGTESCGVQRQWCGRLGKTDNCQVGVFLGYASSKGHTLVDRRLYLPKDWTADARRRKKAHVPRGVRFQEKWQIAERMVREHGRELPHAWVVADDEFGRVKAFRRRLRRRGERYVLDVPSNTQVRDLDERLPHRRGRQGRRTVPYRSVQDWAARQPAERWQRFEVRDGEKGPLVVEAIVGRVHAKEAGGVRPKEERLLVIRTLDETPKYDYCLSNARAQEPIEELVRVRGTRHRIEENFQQGNGEGGCPNSR